MARASQAEIDAAWKAFDDAPDDGDYSWIEDLPDTPDLPTNPDQVVATFLPTIPVVDKNDRDVES